MSKSLVEQAIELGYRAGFLAACSWHEPVPQDMESAAFLDELREFMDDTRPEGGKP